MVRDGFFVVGGFLHLSGVVGGGLFSDGEVGFVESDEEVAERGGGFSGEAKGEGEDLAVL